MRESRLTRPNSRSLRSRACRFAALASLCYSVGTLFSVPGETAASRELKPVCTTAFDVQVPPFGTRDFPVEREGNSYFSLKTRGDSVVLQMLHPSNEGVRIYIVNSSIKFGGEVTEGKH